MFDDLNKELKTVTINLSEIIQKHKDNLLSNSYDKKIKCKLLNSYIDIKIIANNKNYIIIADKIEDSYNIIYTVKLIGYQNGNLIVKSNQNYTCHVKRGGEGHGHAIRIGTGEGNATRYGLGNGSAIKTGSGSGNASRYDKGIGHAIKIGDGDGIAWRSKYNKGGALKIGSGKGNSYS